MSGFDWWGWDFGDYWRIGGDFLVVCRLTTSKKALIFKAPSGSKYPPFNRCKIAVL